MRSMYRKFVGDYCVSRYSRFVQILLEDHDKAVLWHCSAGKDRAGVGAVIIEEILGVPRETIISDYGRLEIPVAYIDRFEICSANTRSLNPDPDGVGGVCGFHGSELSQLFKHQASHEFSS